MSEYKTDPKLVRGQLTLWLAEAAKLDPEAQTEVLGIVALFAKNLHRPIDSDITTPKGLETDSARASLQKETGRILKERRKNLSLTQTQLSAAIGMDQSQLAKIENGKLDIRLSTLKKVAEGLEARALVQLNFSPPEGP